MKVMYSYFFKIALVEIGPQLFPASFKCGIICCHAHIPKRLVMQFKSIGFENKE